MVFAFSKEEREMPPLVLPSLEALKESVGREIGCSEWFAVTQDRIQRFADVTEDQQWIHLDRERAERESPYGTTIAHGFLTLSLISRFMKDVIQVRSGTGMTVNYGLNRVRFPSPVRAGSKVRARVVLLNVKEVPGAYETTFSMTVDSEGGEEPCCVAESFVRYYVQVPPASDKFKINNHKSR